jgi:hypothetical protein
MHFSLLRPARPFGFLFHTSSTNYPQHRLLDSGQKRQTTGDANQKANNKQQEQQNKQFLLCMFKNGV